MLHLPPAVAQVVTHLQQQLNGPYRGPSKPMAPERMHITLVPLGTYEHGVPPEALETARRAGAQVVEAPFRVCFDTLQSRGPERQVGTVELAGHGAGVLPLFRLRKQWVAALLRVGWPGALIRPGFFPHITVDYGREPVGVRRIEPLAWNVTEVLLVDSHHGRGHHEVLARWPLQDRQPSLFG
jgi:2'-5' RNA ligase